MYNFTSWQVEPGGQDDRDLLGVLVAVAEPVAHAGLQDVEREPDRLGIELLAREDRLADVGHAVLRGHVLTLAQVLDRVAAHAIDPIGAPRQVQGQPAKLALFDMDGTLLDLYFDNHFWLHYLPQKQVMAKDSVGDIPTVTLQQS